MTEPGTTDCDAMRVEIDSLQKEFETLWLQVSAGGAPSVRYRELRRTIDRLRASYAAECGPPSEESSLPPRIMSDWRAG
ncbi:MAG: hypothetical protein ACAH65_05080 [Chloroflexota bacterium]